MSLKNLELHYFIVEGESPTAGRGEFIRLLLEDAGIEFEYVRHTFGEWWDHKEKLLSENIPDPTLPYIRIDGKFYGKTGPILRYLSNKLGKYGGSNEEEAHLVDAYADMVMDWTTKWVSCYFNKFTENEMKAYKEVASPQYFKTFNNILSGTKGPFLLGEDISYADFFLYHIMEDDTNLKFDSEKLPYIATFIKSVQNRPNLKAYFATDRK